MLSLIKKKKKKKFPVEKNTEYKNDRSWCKRLLQIRTLEKFLAYTQKNDVRAVRCIHYLSIREKFWTPARKVHSCKKKLCPLLQN